MSFHLRLLYISEVHASGRERPAAWNWGQSGAEGWLRDLDPLRDDLGIDLVCVTGRAASRGLDSQQSRATGFLATTLDRLGLGWERLFIVPGGNPPAPRPADARPAEPGCRRELRLAHLPFGVQVISLDAAWPGSATGARRPWLTAAAVERLASGPLGEPLPGFRLGLLQQRLTELVPLTARRLAERVDLLLSGDAQAVEVAGGEVWLTAGSAARPRTRSRRANQVQDGHRRSNHPRGDGRPPLVSQVITVTCDSAGRPSRVILRLRPTPPAAMRRLRSVPAASATRLRAVPAARHGAATDLAGAIPAATAEPVGGTLGFRLAEDCARAAQLARSAGQLLAAGRPAEALQIYRQQLLPLYQALAALPPRGLLVRRIAEALAQVEGPGAPDQPGGPSGSGAPV